MIRKLLIFTDGRYTLEQTEAKNQLFFYRNDGKALLGSENILPFVVEYIMEMVKEKGEFPNMCAINISYKMVDKRTIMVELS